MCNPIISSSNAKVTEQGKALPYVYAFKQTNRTPHNIRMALPSLHLVAALKTTPSIFPRLPFPGSTRQQRSPRHSWGCWGGCSTARRWGFTQPKPGHGGAPRPVPVQAPRPTHRRPGGVRAAHVGKGAPWVLSSRI